MTLYCRFDKNEQKNEKIIGFLQFVGILLRINPFDYPLIYLNACMLFQ